MRSHRRFATIATRVTALVALLAGFSIVAPAAAPALVSNPTAFATAAPVVGIASTPSGGGYWQVGADGAIFTAGDAPFLGSLGGVRLNQPIVGMAATPSGDGYWLVASDGGIFSFGDARFYGSTGGMRLNRPIVGMAGTKSGVGYWMVASDGGIFSFGDARFFGSTGSIALNRPIVDMARAADGSGYLLAAEDGGVFLFGSAQFFGSAAAACPTSSATGVAMSGNGSGYWITFGDARTYAFARGTTAPDCPLVNDLYNRLNAERAARGLPALAWHHGLAQYATSWSQNMAANGFRHSNINNMWGVGSFSAIGENIAWGNNASAASLHSAWMNSTLHRNNMLSPGYNAVGIGFHRTADGKVFATTSFGRAI